MAGGASGSCNMIVTYYSRLSCLKSLGHKKWILLRLWYLKLNWYIYFALNARTFLESKRWRMSDKSAEISASPSQGQRQGTQPAAVNAQRLFNAYPATMVCPHCKITITTTTQPDMGTLAWLACMMLCPVCLCCLPCCVDDLKDVTHQCPSCNAFLGVYKRI